MDYKISFHDSFEYKPIELDYIMPMLTFRSMKKKEGKCAVRAQPNRQRVVPRVTGNIAVF